MMFPGYKPNQFWNKQFNQLDIDNSSTLDFSNSRELFYRLIHPDSHHSVILAADNQLTLQIKALENRGEVMNLFSGQTGRIRDEIEALRQTCRIRAVPDSCSLSGLIRQYAPTALTELCWLQSTSQANLAHTKLSALLFKIYTEWLGFHSNSKKRIPIFRQVLSDFNILLPDTHTWLFAANPGFIESSLKAPITSLCLAQLPVTYLPVILGYTLAHCCDMSVLLELFRCKAKAQSHVPESLQNYLHSAFKERAKELIIQAVDAQLSQLHPSQYSEFWKKLACGVFLFIDAEHNLLNDLVEQSASIQSVWCDSVKNQQLSSESQGSLAQIRLCGVDLDEWFSTEPWLAAKCVKSMISDVNPDHQHARLRRFFSDTSVFDDHSFSESELDQLQQLDSDFSDLKFDDHSALSDNPAIENEISGDASRVELNSQHDLKKYSSRRLYFELLNIESHPRCLIPAYHFVCRYLKKSRAAMQRIRPVHNRLIQYSHAGLDRQIRAIYQAEMNQLKDFRTPPKLSESAYLWGIEQFAPVLLVDGSWLQNIAKIGNHHHSICQYLWRIYADEIGDGRHEWNHANVYRKLLNSTNIELPEFTSKAFSQHTGFIDSAFDLPVFFLALSQFPSSFEAETIGLNLAIELSGLGSTYSHLVKELDYWNIDSTIVSLHLSIDNLETGHAALAQDAVTVYLDQILNSCGYLEMQHHWQRIWSGYLALQVIPAQFKRALIWNYFKRFVFMPKISWHVD